MNLKLISLLLAFCAFQLYAMAHTVKVISATTQSWSGGVAGRSGTNEQFEIEFSGFKSEPIPDTMWMGDETIPLIITNKSNFSEGNTICIRSKKSVTFKILGQTYRDEYAERFPPGLDPKKKNKVSHPPKPYKGVALISYKIDGKEYWFEVPKYTKTLPAINYP
jgi:hypothetical protein